VSTDENGNPFHYETSRAIFDRLDRTSARDLEREPHRTSLIEQPPAHIEAAELELDAAAIDDLETESDADRRQRLRDALDDEADRRYDEQRDDRATGGES
jgi:hypothetical protein